MVKNLKFCLKIDKKLNNFLDLEVYFPIPLKIYFNMDKIL